MYTIGTIESKYEELEKLYPLGKPITIRSGNVQFTYYYYELPPALYTLILLTNEVHDYLDNSTKNGIWVEIAGDFMFDKEADHLRAVKELKCIS